MQTVIKRSSCYDDKHAACPLATDTSVLRFAVEHVSVVFGVTQSHCQDSELRVRPERTSSVVERDDQYLIEHWRALVSRGSVELSQRP